MFKCKGSTTLEDSVIGHLVRGKDAIVGQYGAGLSVPRRFINRYLPGIIFNKPK